MKSMVKTAYPLEEAKVNVRIKIAALWVSFMFLYIYVDYFALYMPDKINDIMQGKVFVFDISPEFIMIALGLSTIPMLMVFFSVVLPAKLNRFVNIIVALLHIPYMLFNLSGEAWMHMIYAAVVEVAILLLITVYAWKWPCIDG